MSLEKTIEAIRKKLESGLEDSLVGKHFGRSITEDQAKISIQKILSNMEADLFGYDIVKCDIMWNTMSLKEKAKWWYSNILFKFKGRKERSRIEQINQKRYQEALKEECGYEVFVDREKYPYWAEPNPKSILNTEIKIKPTQSIQFLEFNGILSLLDEKEKPQE